MAVMSFTKKGITVRSSSGVSKNVKYGNNFSKKKSVVSVTSNTKGK